MKIACLAWGSLVWDPRGLPYVPPWRTDGPAAAVEFARLSRDGRLTLVLRAEGEPVPLLWAMLKDNPPPPSQAREGGESPPPDLPHLRRGRDLEAALLALRDREGITTADWRPSIGFWQVGGPSPAAIPALAGWADARGLDAVIWTALGPRFVEGGVEVAAAPSIGQALAHLGRLSGEARARAEAYIRNTPAQIDTPYRRVIEAKLGWRGR